jgi:neutral ceramidase
MNRLFRTALVAWCLFAPSPAGAGEFKAGGAAVRITPPAGGPMAGYYYDRAAEGTHDDLYAKAIVLDDGTNRAAIVACDLIGVPAAVVSKARALASERTGIPADHIMISATHAHTGPSLIDGSFRTQFAGEARRIAEQYIADLPGRIAESIEQASRAAAPVHASVVIGREAGLAFNRRYYMRDGTVRWNPGKGNPDIVRPAGPIDPDVPLVVFSEADGRPRAVYVSHAIHLDTIGGTRYSADFAYTLATLLAAAKGPDLLTLFAIGCAGNVNHIDVSSGEKQSGPEEAARIGTILAADILKLWAGLTPVEDPVLRFGTERVELDLGDVQPGEVVWAGTVAARYGRRDAAPLMDFVRAQKILELDARKGRPLDAEVQVIALGNDVAWVGLPGEMFTELGMAIKQASPFRYTIVAGLANGSLGYIPNRKAYAEGAYEAVSSRAAPGSGERLVEAATRLLIGLHGAPRATAGVAPK